MDKVVLMGHKSHGIGTGASSQYRAANAQLTLLHDLIDYGWIRCFVNATFLWALHEARFSGKDSKLPV